jgi:hypothetical protein
VKALEKLSDLRASGEKQCSNSRCGGNQSQDAGKRAGSCLKSKPRKEAFSIFHFSFFIWTVSMGLSFELNEK